MTCGIYKIVNKINGKIYVGQSVDIEKRWGEHRYNIQYHYKKNHLYKAIRKYGLDNFEFSVIVECDECMLDEFEIGIIKLHDTTNPDKGYNKMTGGANGRPTDETKQKMSISKQNMSVLTKQKMSDAKKGKPKTKEHKQKISEAGKGNKRSIKQYIYQNQTFTGLQALADFLRLNYFTLASKIYNKTIIVTIIKE